jgi:hypothetical protein
MKKENPPSVVVRRGVGNVSDEHVRYGGSLVALVTTTTTTTETVDRAWKAEERFGLVQVF